MSNTVKPFGSIAQALITLISDEDDRLGAYPSDARSRLIGGDFAFEPASMPFYIRIDKVPGSRTDRFGGDFTVDVEVFGDNYLEAESHALDIEALLLGYPHVVEVEDHTWVFDTVTQNSAPDELPWEDDRAYRLGATYVITARRR